MENNLPKPQTNNGLPVPPSFPKPETALPLPELEIPAHANHGYTVKPSHPHHGFKWLKWLLLFFVITTFILIAALYMLLSNAVIMNNKQSQEQSSTVVVPTTPPQPTVATINTSNWLTYTDPTLAATFEYPSSWKLSKGQYTSTLKDSWSADVTDPSYEKLFCRPYCSSFGVAFSVDNNDQNLSVVDFLKKDDVNKTNFSELKLENITLPNGIASTRVTGGLPGTTVTLYSFYIPQNKKMYRLSVFAGTDGSIDDINNPKVKENIEIANKILSTFQFTTPTSTQSGAQIPPVEAVIEGRG